MNEWEKSQEIIVGYFFRDVGTKEVLLQAIALLRDDFFTPEYVKLWKIIKLYYIKYNSVITIQTFREFCRANKVSETKLAEIETVIFRCVEMSTSAMENPNNILWYVGRLPDLYKELKIRDILEESNKFLYASGYDKCRDYLLKSVSGLDSVSNPDICKEGVIRDEIKPFVASVRAIKDDRSIVPVYSGFPSLDNESVGFRGGDVCLISGYAGVGKTSFLINMAINVAYVQKKNVLFITTETIHEQIMRRLVSRLSKFDIFPLAVPSIKLKSGNLSDDEQTTLTQIETYMELPEHGSLFIVQAPANANLSWVRGKLLEYESRKKLHVLLLDDLRNMKPLVRRKAEWEEFNELLKDFKALARTHAGRGIPVISPYQFTRESFKEALQNGGQYNLSALSSSSEAERISDVVLSLWEDTDVPGEIRMEILKMRDGKKGRRWRVRFDAAYQYMDEIIDLSTANFGFNE